MNINPAAIRLQTGMKPSLVSMTNRQSRAWTITHIVSATLRRRRTVGAVALICFMIAAAYASLAAPTYTSMASVVLDTKLTPPSPGNSEIR
jgi:succinoglycan biosynthesis transport protein ExoP